MSARERMTLAAAMAALLAGTALLPLFEDRSWVWRAVGAVVTVALVGLVCRRLAVPALLQPALGVAALGYYLCEAFARGTMRLGLVPTGRTLHALSALVASGRVDIARYGPPVPAHLGLVLLASGGIGAVALLVDVLAVLLEKPAVAGLPLLALLAVPSAVLPGGLGWLPFSLGAAGWLGLLLVEGRDRVGRWGAPAGSAGLVRGQDSSLGRVGRRVGAAALGMAVIVPALLPGLDNRLLPGSGGAGGGSGGGGARSTTTYNPITSLGEELSLPQPRELLTYTTTDPQPDYLRLTTLDRFDGTSWLSSPLRADRQQDRVQDGIARAPGETSAHQDLSMRVSVRSLEVKWLPVPFGPTDVQVRGSWLWDAQSQTVFSTERDTKAIKPYTVTASRALPDRDALEAAGNTVDPAIGARYGQPIAVTPYVEGLTEAITRRAATSYDRAAAVQQFFRSAEQGFVYDLRASTAAPGADQLEAFLRGRHGFCEQYATAMAVMLRVAGVPSRVAVGFTPGVVVKGQKHSVTTSDAHAWPEAWFAGTGWVRFEPTPPQSTAVVPTYSIPQGAVPGPVAGGGSPVVPSPAPTGSARPLPEKLNDRSTGTPGAARTGPQGPSIVPLVLLAIVGLLAVPALLAAARRRRRWLTPAGSRPLTAWRQLQDDAADTGHRWRPSQSPRAAAARLAAERRFDGPVAAALGRLAVAAERARYAPSARAGSAEDDHGLRADAATLRNALLQGVSTSTRWRARLLPPSTLGWAAAALGAAVGGLLDRVDGAIAAVGRVVRRRPAGA